MITIELFTDTTYYRFLHRMNYTIYRGGVLNE